MPEAVLLLCCPRARRLRHGLRRGQSNPAPGGRPHRRDRIQSLTTRELAGSPSRGAEIFFPRAKGAGFEAQVVGKPLLDGAGCLRLRIGSDESTMPLWMRGWRLEAADGGPRVLDGRGRTVGRVGGKV